MWRTLLLAFFILAVTTNNIRAKDTDNLLKTLDNVLDKKEFYIREREDRIKYLKLETQRDKNSSKNYYLNKQIIDEYLHYKFDSALVYINKNKLLGSNNKDDIQYITNRIQYATLLSTTGLFLDAKIVLDSIKQKGIPSEVQLNYYLSNERLLMNICDYIDDENLNAEYEYLLNENNKVIYEILDNDSPLRYLYKYRIKLAEKNLDEALHNIEIYVSRTQPGTHNHAIACYSIAEVYRYKKNTTKEIEALVRSVISDTESATMENASMLLLASKLYENEDIEHAYKYITSALEDANFYNARFRNMKISKILPVIEKAYQQKNDLFKNRLWFYSVIISVLVLLVLIIAFLLYKQKRKLSIAKENLKDLNNKQKEFNNILKEKNAELLQANKQLLDYTNKLFKTNSIHEEYIRQFLQMCSIYIKKLDEFRKNVNRKIVAGQIAELQKITATEKGILNEKQELYQLFDILFLKLYPHFIDQVNSLLQKEYKINKTNNLSSETRILALICLGLKESSQISEFLGYTPSTIYTYRTKMRNKAINHDSFEEDVIKIISLM